MIVKNPSLLDVQTTFLAHAKYWRSQDGGEAALGGLQVEDSVALQYAGRVVLELVQNALDCAERAVEIHLDNDVLIVGNDGDGVSVDPTFDYARQNVRAKRSNFHALCSVGLSSKTPNDQFGSKGIGFRSVFGVAETVQVWSRFRDTASEGWWGFELRRSLSLTDWVPTDLPEYDGIVLECQGTERPSYHFPKPLFALTPPGPSTGLSTLIVVPVRPDCRGQIEAELQMLAGARLHFVALRKAGVQVTVRDTVVPKLSGWVVRVKECEDLAEKAKRAKHEIPTPRVAVAFPPGRTEAQGNFYNYLPTRMVTGLPADVHGDFQVKADRESMGLAAGNPVGDYNVALLNRAATAYVALLDQCLSESATRDDFWVLARCPNGVGPEWVNALRGGIWPAGSFGTWLGFAERFFRTADWPDGVYREFWVATESWLSRWHTRKSFEVLAKDLCKDLALKGLLVIPVPVTAGPRAVALPLAGTASRHLRRVFYDPQGAISVALPRALVRTERAITGFSLDRFSSAAEVVPYNAQYVLPDLRQIPNDPSQLDWSKTLTHDEQRELLAFAKNLLPEDREPHFAWRAYAETTKRRWGRALSTLFLPVWGGKWAPARQLRADDVDDTLFLQDGAPLLDAGFLRQIGVAPEGGVPLVEEGDAAVVSPVLLPPALQAAGDDNKKRELLPLRTYAESFEAVRRTVAGLPADNEHAGVLRSFAAIACVPSGKMRQHRDLGLPPLPELLRPDEIVLNRDDPRRGRFLAVPQHPEDDEVLGKLGAIARLEDLRVQGAARTTRTARIAMLNRHLALRFADIDRLPTDLSRGLAEVHDAILSFLPADDEPYSAPVLVESNMGLQWLPTAAEAFIATEAERAPLRRAFPSIRLVAATGGAERARKIGASAVRLRSKVLPTEGDPTTPIAQGLHRRIGALLGALAARYEVSRLSPIADEARIRQAWARQPLRQVQDAYLELLAENTPLPPRTVRQNDFDDAFCLDNADHTGPIVFDINLSRGTAPPLRHFGEALALLLFNNRAAGPLLAEVLAAADATDALANTAQTRVDPVADVLDRCDATDCRRQWDLRLAPIAAAIKNQLISKLQTFCTDASDIIDHGRIRRRDLAADCPATTVTELEAELAGVFASASAENLLPRVLIRDENARDYEAALSERAAALRALLNCRSRDERISDSGFAAVFAIEHSALDLLNFSPIDELRRNLLAQNIDLSATSLDVALAEYRFRFTDVTARPVAAAGLGWTSTSVAPLSVGGGPERKLDQKDIADADAAKTAFGDAAERAFVHGVVQWTLPLLEREGARAALLAAIEGEKTRAAVKAALEAQDIPRALWVSQLWSGLGFDVIGLGETQDGGVVVERYECKGLPKGEGKVRVHLSRREWAVAERCRVAHQVWRLVGIEESGRAIDLTKHVSPLQDSSAFANLATDGIESDGWRITVDRSPSAA